MILGEAGSIGCEFTVSLLWRMCITLHAVGCAKVRSISIPLVGEKFSQIPHGQKDTCWMRRAACAISWALPLSWPAW